LSCRAKNREALIQKYVLSQLTETEREDFDRHMYDCSDCFKDVTLREGIAEVFAKEKSAFRINLVKGISRVRNVYRSLYVAAFVVLALSAGLTVYRANVPEYYTLARLTEPEIDILLSGPRDAADENDKAWRTSARALVQAQGTKYIWIPHFDSSKVRIAIVHLRRALATAGASDYKRNKYRYFLAKSYLMRGQDEQARSMLGLIIDGNSDAFLKEAKSLQHSLE
jgi:hypothetical protein